MKENGHNFTHSPHHIPFIAHIFIMVYISQFFIYIFVREKGVCLTVIINRTAAKDFDTCDNCAAVGNWLSQVEIEAAKV